MRINIDEEQTEEEEVRKRPVELGEKVSETLEVNRRELLRLENLIMEKEIEKVGESCLNCSVILVMMVVAFVVGVCLPVG